MDTEVLGFIFTEKCNFRCRHCCNDSSPNGTTTMDLDEIVTHINEAALLEGLSEIGISGGEPFLFPRQVIAMVQAAHMAGLSASVTSNGFWARSPERAREVLQPLVDNGLASLNLSISVFHLAFTTPEKLNNAARAALDLGLETRVNVVQSSNFTPETATKLFEPLTQRLEFVVMPLIPAGRAAEAVFSQELQPSNNPLLGNCHEFFSKVAVTATGDVYPCCSPGGFTPPLLQGNLREASLREIRKSMESSLLLQVLDDVGPAFFLPFIDRALGRTFLDDGFVDQCHLCHTVLSDPILQKIAADAISQLEAELVAVDMTLSEIRSTSS